MSAEEKCKHCGAVTKPPDTQWLTTAQVLEQYKLDPNANRYIGRLRSKLVRIQCDGCRGWVRVWLKDDLDTL